ncbi:MAG: hypothetical protein FWF53_02735 [Candidatus Azobacteroides sp.]|nr:hypothetical protein [Candidatus Azobacteroides sp.]
MKRIILGLAGMIFMASINAQFLPRSFNSSNQQLIEEAVKGGIFIIRQSYQLKDTNTDELYGFHNAEHFGYTVSVGIKAQNGYYLDNMAVEPWKYDNKFIEYNDQKQYLPVISESKYRSLTDDSAFSDLPYDKDKLKVLSGGQFYFAQDSFFDNQGFDADNSDGNKDGWLIWVVSSDSIKAAGNESLSLLVYRNELTFEPGKNTYKIKEPPTDNRVLGGLYVVPEVTGIGKISFCIGGLLNKKEGYWQVVRLTESIFKREIIGDKPVKEGLTPIQQKGK